MRRKNIQKTFSRQVYGILLTVCFMLALCFVITPYALAVDGTIESDGTYAVGDYGNDSTITIDSNLTVTLTNTGNATFTNLEIVCGEGVDLTIDGVIIDNSAATDACALSFTGGGNSLTLVGASSLAGGKDEPAVRVEDTTSLEIKGDGSLTATGGENSAGIGSGNGTSSGDITISGGEVTATGGKFGAGVGGGGGGGGTITISGGEVTATGGEFGAGVGGGGVGGGTITISDGTITATGGESSAGIGGGYDGSGDITISGGKVTANGGEGSADISGAFGGAGIGGGASLSGIGGGDITITDGEVTATGGGISAGIGGGYGGSGGTISISGGAITATGGVFDLAGINYGGAGIGGGYGGDGGVVTISGGEVTANGVYGGAGIGGGTGGAGDGSAGGDGGTVTISGGTVNATGGYEAAGIGGSAGGDGGTVKISGGSVNAAAGAVGADDIGMGANGSNHGALQNAEGAAVYLTTVTLAGINSEYPVSSLTTNAGYTYGTTDMMTDANGKLYVWLPEDTVITGAQAIAGRYEGSITTTIDSSTSLGTLTEVVETEKPTVSSVTPSGDSIALSSEIIITFSEAMDTATPGTVSLDGGATTLTAGAWSNYNQTYTVSYSVLKYITTYTISISGFADTSGNIMEPNSDSSFTTMPGGGNGAYLIESDGDPAYSGIYTDAGLLHLTVKHGVSGFTYFKVNISGLSGHPGEEVCVFVQKRNSEQIGFSFIIGDFETVSSAGAAFNVQAGDVIEVYFVDALSNNANENPNVL